MQLRRLCRDEIAQIWTIDRSEVIDAIYYLRDGRLVLEPEHYDMQGWPPGEAEIYEPLLLECFDRGGAVIGAYDGTILAGVVVVDTRWLGANRDLLQLKFLHVSQAYRGQGLGRQLFAEAQAVARQQGARGLYVSATPSEHTVNFYRSLGCEVTRQPDPELLALEPEDIQLVCRLDPPVETN